MPPSGQNPVTATTAPPAPVGSAGGSAAPGGSPGSPIPARSAPFTEKLRYYRSQHTSRGIRLTHLVGIPGVAFSLPLLFARPRVGGPVFALSWAVQIAGHRVFEHNSPAITSGPLTYQLCGLAFWCEEVADLLAGRGLGDAP